MTRSSFAPSRRRALVALGAAGTVLALPFAARAQVGGKAVRIILPNATGSGVDAITRAAQNALGKALVAAIVIDNQPGAGGIVGVQQIARAPADGSTLGVVSNNVVIFPSVYKSLPFDLATDITPIAIVGTTPMVLVVNPKVPATNSKELVALLKSKPGQINYGSGGAGTILHLATAMYLDEAGVTALHVPYKGVGPMVTDLLGGQIEMATAALPSVQGQIKAGQLRAIGVTTAKRVPAAPEIPTFVEQGLPDFVVDAWFAVIGPKNMPAAEVKKAHDAVVTAFAEPAVVEAMARQGNIINVGSSEVAQGYFKSEMAKYAKLVKKAGIEQQ